jgi:hypothetical protein
VSDPDPVGALLARYTEVPLRERRQIRFGKDAWEWLKRVEATHPPDGPEDPYWDTYWTALDGTLFGVSALLDEALAPNAVEVRNSAGETVQLILLGGL